MRRGRGGQSRGTLGAPRRDPDGIRRIAGTSGGQPAVHPPTRGRKRSESRSEDVGRGPADDCGAGVRPRGLCLPICLELDGLAIPFRRQRTGGPSDPNGDGADLPRPPAHRATRHDAVARFRGARPGLAGPCRARHLAANPRILGPPHHAALHDPIPEHWVSARGIEYPP